MRQTLLYSIAVTLFVGLVGCSRGGGSASGEKYEVLDTRTDQFSYDQAKAQAQDAIARYPDLGCMVGLFAYNPPYCLEAVKEAGKVGEIQVIGFDENAVTLQGIADGEVHGTVVQNPYRYGYESVRILAGLARDDRSVLPEGGFLAIEARKITKANIEEFRQELDGLLAPYTGEAPAADADRPTVGYVTNGVDDFWVIAEKGAQDAGRDFDVNVLVRMPPDGVGDQQRMVQDLLTQGVDGIAISPIDPDNQGELLEEIASRTNLITQDSDAPNSRRLCYVGMDNVAAGRMCGELVQEALPEGGRVMMFVGRLEQLNARQRETGVKESLADANAQASESTPAEQSPTAE